MSTETPNPHHVTVTPDQSSSGEPLPPRVKFECHASDDAACRNYPACECESWTDQHGKEHGPGHEAVPQLVCWMQGWFDNDHAFYIGEDYDEMTENHVPAGMNRRGPITVEYGDGYLEWEYAAGAEK